MSDDCAKSRRFVNLVSVVDYHGDRAMERYERIRMAIFSPDYLVSHREWNDEDFTALLDCIVALLECPVRLKRLLKAIHQYSIYPDPNNSLSSVAMVDATDALRSNALRHVFMTRLDAVDAPEEKR